MQKKLAESFNKKKIFTISIAHFVHDIYPAFFAPMLPLLMAKFGLALSAISILEIARQIPSLFMPLIGFIADKKPIRYFIIFTPAITAISMSMIGLVTSYLVLFLFLFIAGLSTVCFHVPSPVLIKNYSGGQVGKGMSLYMSAGAIAGTVGTFLITMVITYLGFEYSYILMFLGIFTSIILFVRLKNIPNYHRSKVESKNIKYKPIKEFIPFFIILAFFMIFQTGMGLALRLYLPIYLIENNCSIYFAGMSLSIMYFAGAIGMISIGHISDKYSKKKLIFILTILSVILMYCLIKFIESTMIVIPILILLGFILFSYAPLVLSLVQNIRTKRPAFINSIYFMLGFFIKTIGLLLIGFMGDEVGINFIFKVCALAPIFSLPFLYFLPNQKTT